MLWLIVLFPLIGFLLNGLILKPKKINISGLIGSVASGLAFASSLFFVLKFGMESSKQVYFNWINFGKYNVDFAFEYTPLTGVMLMVITFIGTLIHVYSIGYMKEEKNVYRFFSYLNLFLVAMLCLVLSSNLLGVFLGWEGVGLCSYLLIGYWHKDPKNTLAGTKAFIVNRIGDLGFVISLLLLMKFVGSLEISEIILATSKSGFPVWFWPAVVFGLFWASTGKSAQLPLYVWLPDAMAGPTPVSALIHAATMVTSGIFVGVRLWPAFAAAPEVLNIIFWIGVSTAWLGALIAFTQKDLKKVLAYSTVSQLGFMFAALGAGSPVAALFHVVTHACFKALLFLAAGSVIAGVHHHQDMNDMGGLKDKMKWTHICFLVGTLAIIGFPLTSGFFSKEFILLHSLDLGGGTIGFIFLLLAAFATAFYMLRAYTLTFWGPNRSKHSKSAHESSMLMVVPLFVLGFLSLFVGWIETPHIFFHVEFLSHILESSWYGNNVLFKPTKAHSISFELISMLLITGGSLLAGYFSFKKYKDTKLIKEINSSSGLHLKLSEKKFLVDEIYSLVFVKPLKYVANFIEKIIDGVFINGILHGFSKCMSAASALSGAFHSGSIQSYAWLFISALWIFILYFWWVAS